MFAEKKMLRDDLSKELKKLVSFDNSFPPGKTSDISNYILPGDWSTKFNKIRRSTIISPITSE